MIAEDSWRIGRCAKPETGAHGLGGFVGGVGGQAVDLQNLVALRDVDAGQFFRQGGAGGGALAAASASLTGTWAASRARRSGPKIRSAKNWRISPSRTSSRTLTVRGCRHTAAAALRG
jgi:hypothetical protein